MDPCFRRSGTMRAEGTTDIAPADHPCESRGPLRPGPFDKLRANGKIRPVRGEPVEPCELAKGGPFDKLRANGVWGPFVVSLSNHANGKGRGHI